MDEITVSEETRVWWGGGEVIFVRWSSRGLVFAWPQTDETATLVPRGALARLIQKGALHIEGDMPEWAARAYSDVASAPSPAADPMPASRADERRAPPVERSPRDDRTSIIARLIRKLSGGEAPAKARVSPQ